MVVILISGISELNQLTLASFGKVRSRKPVKTRVTLNNTC